MTKPEYFDGTEWKSFCSEGAPVNIENATSSPFPITGSLIVSEGSINVDLGPELDALAVFNQNGLVTRTGDGTYAGRELIAGNGIEIENGNGVNGNPIISAIVLPDPFINDLPINGNLDLESFDLITTGDVSVQNGAFIGNNLRAYDTNSIFVNSSFDMQGKGISNLLTPTNPNDAATKNYVDTVINSPFINDLPINGNLDLESFDLITTGDVNAQNVNAQNVITQFITASNTSLGVVFSSKVQMQNNPIFGLPFLIVDGDIDCRENSFIGNNLSTYDSLNLAIGSNLDLQGNRILSLPSPDFDDEPATKEYVDNLASWFVTEIGQTFLTQPITVTSSFDVQSNVSVVNGAISCLEGDINCGENTFIGNNIAAYNSPSITTGSNLDLQGNRILSLPLPVNLNEPATKEYVDNLVSNDNIQLSVVEISSSQILDLDNHPVSLVECPLGCAILPHNVVTVYIPGTQEYDDDDLDINIAIGSVRFGTVDSKLFQEDCPALDILNLKDIKVVPNKNVINKDLIIYNKDSGLCSGNGTLKIFTWYSTLYLGDIT